jgi:hypothetical protein
MFDVIVIILQVRADAIPHEVHDALKEHEQNQAMMVKPDAVSDARILSKVEEVEINMEVEDVVLTMDEATKERSAVRSGVTRARTEPTTLLTAGTMRRTTKDHKNT